MVILSEGVFSINKSADKVVLVYVLSSLVLRRYFSEFILKFELLSSNNYGFINRIVIWNLLR